MTFTATRYVSFIIVNISLQIKFYSFSKCQKPRELVFLFFFIPFFLSFFFSFFLPFEALTLVLVYSRFENVLVE